MSTQGRAAPFCVRAEARIHSFSISAKRLDTSYKWGEHMEGTETADATAVERHDEETIFAWPVLTTDVMQMFQICIVSMQM